MYSQFVCFSFKYILTKTEFNIRIKDWCWSFKMQWATMYVTTDTGWGLVGL